MSGRVITIERAVQTRLRQDVMAWAREVGFSPRMSLEDPETIVGFIGICITRFPAFTHAHGRAIFAWCKEEAPATDGPEAA